MLRAVPFDCRVIQACSVGYQVKANTCTWSNQSGMSKCATIDIEGVLQGATRIPESEKKKISTASYTQQNTYLLF